MNRIPISNEDLQAHAKRLCSAPSLGAGDLAFDFSETLASSVHLHVEGRNFYPHMLAEIREASTSVHMILFGFWPGNVGNQFVDALVAKASENVPVRLIVDSRGTDPDRRSREIFRRMTDAGVEVCVNRATQVRVSSGRWNGGGANRWNLDGLTHIDHRKVLIIDGKIAWVGGGGIADHFENSAFLDLYVRVEGSVVAQLQLVFLASWLWLEGRCSSSDVEILFPDRGRGEQDTPVTVLHNAPGRFRPLSTAITELVESAEQTLDIVNPYVTNRAIIRRIENVAKRGVRTRLFVPAHSNHPACAAAEQFHHARLLEAGVQILGHPQMLHAKALLADGRCAIIGSCNLDSMSLKRFFEIDIRVHSREIADQFEDQFLAPAELVSVPMLPPVGISETVRAAVFAALSPLL